MKAELIRQRDMWLKICLMVLCCVPLLAQAGQPTDSLRSTIDEVLAVLSDNAIDVAAKRDRIREVINVRFDYRAMSQSTLAQNWRRASDAQQQRFVELYARMMQDTYLVLVEEYNSQEVRYGDEKIRKEKYAQVNTLILDAGKQIPVHYKLRLKDGDWYVYDVIIEGVSMVSNYRSSYQQIVKRDGLDGLIAKIEAKLTATP